MSKETVGEASTESPRNGPRKRLGSIPATSEQSRHAVREIGHARTRIIQGHVQLAGHATNDAASVESSSSSEARCPRNFRYSNQSLDATQGADQPSSRTARGLVLSTSAFRVKKVRGRGQGARTVYTRRRISIGRGLSAARPLPQSVHGHDPATAHHHTRRGRTAGWRSRR